MITKDLKLLGVNISERLKYISDEKTTKQALVIPFFQILGFDIFNPLEFFSHYKSNSGIEFDYAIFKDTQPSIFIIAKSFDENLNCYYNLIRTYLNSNSEIEFIILTNGIEYKFFTNLISENTMDSNPFFQFNIMDLSDSDIATLHNFKKENFNKESLINQAEELVEASNLAKITLYKNLLSNGLIDMFTYPSDQFIDSIISNIIKSDLHPTLKNNLTSHIKKLLSNSALNIMSENLNNTMTPTIINKNYISAAAIKSKNATVATKDEIRVLEIIKEILLKHNKDIKNITYKATTNYFSVYLENPNKWILRFNLDTNKIKVITKLEAVKNFVYLNLLLRNN